MLLSACFVLILSIVFLVLNHRNKVEYVILLYMISLSLLMSISAVYIYKLTSYSFSSFGDFTLFQLIDKLSLSLSDVARLQNIGFALLMCSSVLFILFFRHSVKLSAMLFAPVLLFLILNDPSFTWNLYLESYLSGNENKITFLVTVFRYISIFIYVIYSALPMILLLLSAYKTRIRVRKKDCMIYFLCLFLLNCFTFITFFVGTFKAITFPNVDLMKFPVTPLSFSGKYAFSPYIIVFIALFIFLLIIFFQPFREWQFVTKKELIYNAQQIRQNLRMTLHTYKNSFLGVQRTTELLKQYLSNGETERINSCIEMLDKISSENLQSISHTIALMKNVNLKYSNINIINCIESAIRSSCLPETIRVDRQYDAQKLAGLTTIGDAGHLQEALVNLLTNAEYALRFKKNVVPTISIHIIAEENICLIEIWDNGCGIEKSQLHNIFKSYYSTKTTNNSFGIGLSYVETVIRQHRGSITVKSVQNEYTSFQIVLPTAKTKEKFWNKKLRREPKIL